MTEDEANERLHRQPRSVRLSRRMWSRLLVLVLLLGVVLGLLLALLADALVPDCLTPDGQPCSVVIQQDPEVIPA